VSAVFEWAPSNLKIAYPFVEQVSSPNGLHELFADFYVMHNKFCQKTSSLFLTRFDPTGDLQLKFTDGTVLVYLTAADNFTSTIYGSWTSLQWYRSSNSGLLTNDQIVVRILIETAKLIDFSFPVSPSNAEILPTLVVPQIDHVTQLITSLPNGPLLQAAGNKVILEAGYNIRMDVEDDEERFGLGLGTTTDEVRPKKRIVFNAVSGEGAGKYNDCTEPTSIKLINDVGPDDDGNVQLEPVDCYWFERILSGAKGPAVKPNTDYSANIEGAKIGVRADCTACCSCDDYVATYTNLLRIWNRAKVAAATIENLRQQYHQLRTHLLELKADRETGLTAVMRVIPRPDFTFSIIVSMMNNSAIDIETAVSLSLALVFDPDILESSYVPRSGILDTEEAHGLQLDPAKAAETYSISFPYLRSAKFAIYSFDLRFEKPNPSGTGRHEVDITVTSTTANGAQSVEDVAIRQLERPTTKR